MPHIPRKQQKRPWIRIKPFENMSEDNGFYSSPAWKKLRKMYREKHPLCRHCAEAGIITPSKHVDHIVPIAKGGEALSWENLQALCLRCHAKKTQADRK